MTLEWFVCTIIGAIAFLLWAFVALCSFWEARFARERRRLMLVKPRFAPCLFCESQTHSTMDHVRDPHYKLERHDNHH